MVRERERKRKADRQTDRKKDRLTESERVLIKHKDKRNWCGARCVGQQSSQQLKKNVK